MAAARLLRAYGLWALDGGAALVQAAITTGVATADMETPYQLENQIDSFRKSLRKESMR